MVIRVKLRPMPPSDPEALERALTRALVENGIEEAFRETVRELVDRSDDEMPRCCDSDCDPCVTALIRAALRVRQLLGAGAP
jgi:hypothetical protein